MSRYCATPIEEVREETRIAAPMGGPMRPPGPTKDDDEEEEDGQIELKGVGSKRSVENA